MSVTSGVFWYEALIDQRGDFYSEVGSQRMQNAYEDNTIGFLIGGAPMATLFSAKNVCLANPDRQSCQRNFSAETSNELIFSGNAKA